VAANLLLLSNAQGGRGPDRWRDRSPVDRAGADG